jgi:hypothetical protein
LGGHRALALARSITTIAPALLPDRDIFSRLSVGAQFRAPPLRGRSVVELQEAAQTLSADDAVVSSRLNASGEDQHVAQALMVPFVVIEVDNPRHIILSGRRSVIRGIRFGLTVAVYEGFIKRGESLCRCGFEEERNGRSVEIPMDI